MSALGHKRTFAVQKGMSALPPKADIRRRKQRHSMRKGPPFGSPSNALIFSLLVPSWLVSSVTSYSAGPGVDHADSRGNAHG